MLRKGITPVIAIVLLLGITVAAVGLVGTQFSDILSGDENREQISNQQRIQSSSYTITGVEIVQQDTSSDPSTAGQVAITVSNTGNNRVDLANAATVSFGVDGQSPVGASSIANGTEWTNEAPAPGESTTAYYEMNSDLTADLSPTKIQLQLQGNLKDTYSCNYESGISFC